MRKGGLSERFHFRRFVSSQQFRCKANGVKYSSTWNQNADVEKPIAHGPEWSHRPYPNTASFPTSRIRPPSCTLLSGRSLHVPCNEAAGGSACIRTSWTYVQGTGRLCPSAEAWFRLAEERTSRTFFRRCRRRLRAC